MSSEVQNVRRSSASHVTALLLPAVVMPLALMGVTAPNGLDAHAAAVAIEDAENDIERCRTIRREEELFGGVEQLEVARDLERALATVVPRERSQIELYTRIREAADRCGLQLTSIRAGVEENIGLAVADTSIVMQEMNVDGEGSLVSLVLFPRALYDAGVPSTTLEATVGRDRPTRSQFDIQLRLGVFHAVEGIPDQSVAANEEASSR